MEQSIWVFKASDGLSVDVAVPSGLHCYSLEPLTQMQHPSVCFLNVCTLKGDGNLSSQDMARRGYSGSPFTWLVPPLSWVLFHPHLSLLDEVLAASQHLCWQPRLREQGDEAVGYGNLSALLQARDHLPREWYLWHWPRNWNRWWSPITLNYVF